MTDNNTGTFVWRELMSPDSEKSVRFYGELFGWKIKATKMSDGTTYQLISKKDGKDQGGIYHSTKAGIPPHWISYIKVDDVDATLKTIEGAGGKTLNPAMDIPDIGRFAVAADPDGAAFVPYRQLNPQPAPASPPMPAVGDFCWEQLSASSLEKAGAFYKKVFGWTTKAGPGGMGVVFYQGERMLASAMQTPQGTPPNWMTFVVVDDVQAANTRVTKLGGSVLMAKIEVPDMGVFSVIKDNVGAVLGLYKGK